MPFVGLGRAGGNQDPKKEIFNGVKMHGLNKIYTYVEKGGRCRLSDLPMQVKAVTRCGNPGLMWLV